MTEKQKHIAKALGAGRVIDLGKKLTPMEALVWYESQHRHDVRPDCGGAGGVNEELGGNGVGG